MTDQLKLSICTRTLLKYRSLTYKKEGFLLSGEIVWRCRKKSCPATLKTNSEASVIIRHKGRHNHPTRAQDQPTFDTKGAAVMDSEESTEPLKTVIQCNLPPDNGPIPENIYIKDEENSIEEEGPDSGTLDLVLSEPFTLKDSFNFIDKDSEELKLKTDVEVASDDNKQLNLQDIINETVDNVVSFHCPSPNVGEMQSSIAGPSTKSDESGMETGCEGVERLQVIKQGAPKQCDKIGDCDPSVILTDIELLGTNVADGSTSGTKRHRTNRKRINLSADCTTCCKEAPGVSIKTDIYNKKKKLKTLESELNNTGNSSPYRIKPCSVVVEKNIAIQMKTQDIYKVNQMNDLGIVLKGKNHNSKIVKKDMKPKPQLNVNVPTSNWVTDIDNNFSVPQNLKTYKSKRDSKPVPSKVENILNAVDSTDNKKSVSATSENPCLNDSALSISLDSEKVSENTTLDFNPPPVLQIGTTKDCLKQNHSKLVAEKVNGLGKNNVSPPKPIERDPPKLLSAQEYTKIKETNKKPIQLFPTEYITQLIRSMKTNKAISFKPVNNVNNQGKKDSERIMIAVPLPTIPHSKNTGILACDNSKPTKTLIGENSTNQTPSTISLQDLPNEKVTDPNTKCTELDLEELLDGAPPFIREVFKCDNIRDGFINEDLIFVLSLLPDMEEMTDTEKLKFQLKMIEMLSEVLSDPVLKCTQ